MIFIKKKEKIEMDIPIHNRLYLTILNHAIKVPKQMCLFIFQKALQVFQVLNLVILDLEVIIQ